jgi:hypothetical protein
VSGRAWKLVHRTMAVLWLSMAIPTLLWWRNSILWVCFMSLYANVAAHWAAAQAAEAEQHASDQPTGGEPE